MNAQIHYLDQHRRGTGFLNFVRRLAKESSNLRLTLHARARMLERDIGFRQVVETLRHGRLESGPHRDECGEWRATMKRYCAGQNVRVAVVASYSERLIIITVM